MMTTCWKYLAWVLTYLFWVWWQMAFLRRRNSACWHLIHTGDDIDPLIKMAFIHDQFEAIHPFPDENGHTGRILNLPYLVQQSLMECAVLFLSRYLIDHRQDYNLGLQKVREEQDWESRVLFMLRAVEQTSQQTYDQVRKLKLG